MRRLLLIFLTFHIGNAIVSQEPQEIKLPTVLPPSPEAAAINKNGQLSVGLFNGGAQASIPIHTIKLGSFTMPITLDYASNGTKVDEIPSRVGLSWVLNAGGAVSRIVHGAPDGLTTRLATPGDPGNTSSASNLALYLNTNPSEYGDPPIYDAEPDEFRYNAPGISGKFVLDNSGNPVEIPYTGNKIQVYGGGGSDYNKIVITNLQGAIYEFGEGPEEITSSHIYVSGLHGWQSIKTAYFLKKITLPNKDFINFSYSSIQVTSATGASQSITRSNGGTSGCMGNPPNCSTNSYTQLSTKVTLVTYNTYYLSSISASDGSQINFAYASRPDYSGDNRVTGITISTVGGFYKNYVLSYLDPSATNGVGYYPGSTNTNKRFFLKEFTQIATNPQEVTDSIKYIFDYNDVNGLPPRLAYSQDHYGYYNGANNNYSLPMTSDGNTWGGYNLADKSSSANYATKGMLMKITYPTGGSDEFDYEANTVPQVQQVQSTASISPSGPGLGESGTNVWTGTINSVQYTQQVNIQFTASHNMYYWESIYQSPPANDPTKPLAIEIKNTTTNTVLYTTTRMVNTTFTYPLTILANNTYQIKLTVTGQAYHGRADVTWDPGSGVSYVTTNVSTGGVRVRKISSYDPVSNKTTNKFFNYHFLADANKISSGIGSYVMGSGNYKSISAEKTYCGACPGCFNLCSFETLSSNSAIPLYMHSGNIVCYRAVIESDDSLFLTGGIEHQYALPEITTGFTVLNNGITNISKDSYTGLGGMEMLTTYFNKDKAVLKTVKNTYKYDSTAILVPVVTSRRNYNHITTTPVSEDDFGQFDASVYSWISFWIQHDSTITKEYDLNGNSLTTYSVDSFGVRLNPLPVKTETMGSDGEKFGVYMKYANHYPSTSPQTTMTNARMLDRVIEKKVVKNGVQISLEKNNFYIWYPGTSNTPLVIEPQTVQTQKFAGSDDTRIRFHAYDNAGNVLEVSKENGARISYIWDYSKSLPIAEIKNASITQDSIAYTSFETANKGYWSYSGSTLSDVTCPTGNYVYSLVGGNVTRAVNSSKTYIVSYWLKNSSGAVSVSGTAISGFPKTHWANNGWTLYEHRIGGTSTVTVSGSGTIDELRLYPVGAYMSTLTHFQGAGISSSSSVNNTLTRYEYDHFNRLKTVRDGNRNILKQYEYAFKQSFTSCSNTTANWVVTGVERCVQSGVNNNYNGQKEREEKDLNNCSPTYLQNRWVSITPTGCSTTSCSGEFYRIPTGGSSCMPGQQIFVYQTYIGGVWECKYYYYWPADGYRTQDYISNNVSICQVD